MTITGSVREGTPLCPLTDPPIAVGGYCTLSVIASDFIGAKAGQGPVDGVFYVLGPGDNEVDGDERVLIEGTLHGVVDLAPALANDPIPLGRLIDATLRGRGAKGTPVANRLFTAEFDGIFRLPFLLPDQHAYYLCPSDADPVAQPVAQDETALGLPTVRLEITFK